MIPKLLRESHPIYHYFKQGFMVLLILLGCTQAMAQCNLKDKFPPIIGGIKSVPATCPNNGKIFVNVNISSGGGIFVYEITKGPVTRIIQSQDSFLSLEPGHYTVRVTGCNGKFSEDTITVGDQYYFPDEIFAYQLDRTNTFRCGIKNDAKIWFYFYPGLRDCYGQGSGNPFQQKDTQFIRTPLRYQITKSNNPNTGFNGVAYDTMKPLRISPTYNYYCKDALIMYGRDTVSNLDPGNYYLRVTDACENYTTSNQIRILDNSKPFKVLTLKFTNDLLVRCAPRMMVRFYDSITGAELPRYHNLQQYENGPFTLTFIDTLANDTTVKNQMIYSTRTPYYIGNTYNLQTRSFKPNTSYKILFKDACGRTQIYWHRTNSGPLKINHFVHCNYLNDSRYFTFNTRTGIYWTKHLSTGKIFNQGSNWGSTGAYLDSFIVGQQYRFYLVDTMCGGFDSITFVHGNVTQNNPAPIFTVDTFGFKKCSPNQQNTFIKLTCTNCNQPGMQSVYVDSGANINPTQKLYMYRHYPAYVYSNQTAYGYYQQPFVAGTKYRTISMYSCGKLDTFTFTVPVMRDTGFSYTADFYLDTNLCNASSTVKLNETLTSNNKISLTGSVVWESGPDEALDYYRDRFERDSITYANYIWDTVTIVKGKSTDIKYPLVFANKELGVSYRTGYYNHMDLHFKRNNYTYSSQIAPNYNNLPAGTYVFAIVEDCGNVLKRDTVQINFKLNGQLRLGGTLAYICPTDTSNKFIFVDPIGGKKSYKYRYKRKGENWSALQTNPKFKLPANTGQGERFVVQVQDSCGKSYTGEVSTATFTGNFFLFPDTLTCLGGDVTFNTAFVPGATYTWTGPKGSITSNINRIEVNDFQASDTGKYQVVINCLDSCIYDTAFHFASLNKDCDNILNVKLYDFVANRISGSDKVNLSWITMSEQNSAGFVVLRSWDMISWSSLGYIKSKAANGSSNSMLNYSFLDSPGTQHGIVYYKLKLVDVNGAFEYSKNRFVTFEHAQSLGIQGLQPNPFRKTTLLDISLNEQKMFTLYFLDLKGNLIDQVIYPGHAGINRIAYTPKEWVKPGTYIIRVADDEKSVSRKVTKF